MKHRIVIFDAHSQFVKALSAYLEDKYGMYFDVMAFDDAEKMLDYMEKEPCQLCFVKRALLNAYQTEKLLSLETTVENFTATKREQGVFQFQSVEQLARDMFELYAEKFADSLPVFPARQRRRTVKLIGFYSPARHIYQSAIALTMGQLLAREKKVLYLNFEPYSGFEYLMQKEFTHDLSDLLFYLGEGDAGFSCHVESMIHQVGNLSYIPPVFSFPDLRAVDGAGWKQFLDRLIGQTEMEIIILDFTEQVEGLLDLLPLCDEIYTGYEESGLAEAKMKQYEKMLSYMQKESITEKTRTFAVPVFREIPRQASLFTHSELGEMVKKILDESGSQERGQGGTDGAGRA